MFRPMRLTWVEKGGNWYSITPFGKYEIIKYNDGHLIFFHDNSKSFDKHGVDNAKAICQNKYDELWLAGSVDKSDYITDSSQIVGDAIYIVFAIGQRTGGELHIYDPHVMPGWEYLQRTPNCYVALPMPVWQPSPPTPK